MQPTRPHELHRTRAVEHLRQTAISEQYVACDSQRSASSAESHLEPVGLPRHRLPVPFGCGQGSVVLATIRPRTCREDTYCGAAFLAAAFLAAAFFAGAFFARPSRAWTLGNLKSGMG